MSMMNCLNRLEVSGGQLTKIPGGYKVVVNRGKLAGVLFWFPTTTGNGLINRGMVDRLGFISGHGRQAIERFKE